MGYTLRKSKIAKEQYGQSLTPLEPGKRPAAAFDSNPIPLNIQRPRKHGLVRDLHQLWEHFLGVFNIRWMAYSAVPQRGTAEIIACGS